MDKLSGTVVEQDHKLERSADGATSKLMEFRWHWTLDESNPERVAFKEYARQVGRDDRVIRRHAHGYVLLQAAAASGRSMTLVEAQERAGMSAETEAATEAVASARGVGLHYARQEFATEARHIRDTARQVAEERGTSTVDEIPQVAAMTYKSREADRRTRDERATRRTFRYLEVEGALSKARQSLLAAVRASEGVDFDGEERELLQDTLDNVSRLLALLDRAIAGRYDKSWKDELRVLEGGKAS